MSDSGDILHKFRLCEDKKFEDGLRLIFLNIVFISSLLSVFSAYKLHQIGNFYSLFKKSKSFLCFSTRPVIHRSLITSLAMKMQVKELNSLLREHYDDCKDYIDDFSVVHGKTALQIATRSGYSQAVKSLVEAGADPSLEDKQGNTSIMIACQMGHHKDLQCLLTSKKLTQRFIMKQTKCF